MKVCFLNDGAFVQQITAFSRIATRIAQGQVEITKNPLEADVLVTDSAKAYSHERAHDDARTFLFISSKPQTVAQGTYVGNISQIQDLLSNLQLG